MATQTLKTESGEELVVLSRREYDSLLARLGEEGAEDRMTLILAAEARAEAPLPESVSAAILAGDSVLKSLRVWRGMTQVQLAEAVGIGQGYLSELEARAKTGSPETLEKLARCLDVQKGWRRGLRRHEGAPSPLAGEGVTRSVTDEGDRAKRDGFEGSTRQRGRCGDLLAP
jgi:transcriptional regulator with XRE-family HTH domain